MLKRLAILATVTTPFAIAGALAAVPETPLSEGDRVQVKGVFSGDLFLVDEIERIDEASSSVKGSLDSFDPSTGEIAFGALRLRIDDETRIQDLEGEPGTVALLAAGSRVKVSLRVTSSGDLRVRRVRLLDPAESDRVRLEGRVDGLTHLDSETYFELLGLRARADTRTRWRGVARPRYVLDDEDVRPGRGLSLGRLGHLNGEVRLDLIGERDFDLAEQIEGDQEALRGRVRLEWIFPSTRHVTGMLQIKAEQERTFVEGEDRPEDEGDLRLGRAYVMLHNVVGKRGTVQIGRSRFDDSRDWLFNRDLDAVRLFYDWSRFRLEAGVAEELVDPVPRLSDSRFTFLSGTLYPAKKVALTAFVLDRDDRRTVAGDPRDFSPRHSGLRLEGYADRWKYWCDAVLARGRDRGVPIEGFGVDAGVVWLAPGKIRPSLTVAYALGSGDDDPQDGISETFRQSGLQLNNMKFNGVSSFRYYGELMRPELANLRIETYGIGIRPKDRISLDLVYHRYRLDEPASELVDAAMDDRTLNLVDLDIGTEFDLILGHEQLKHWEFELDLGWFEPGEAFLGPTDPAAMARFKAKFVF